MIGIRPCEQTLLKNPETPISFSTIQSEICTLQIMSVKEKKYDEPEFISILGRTFEFRLANVRWFLHLKGEPVGIGS